MSWCFYTKDIWHTASSVIEYAHFQIYQIMQITYSPVLESQALLLCDSANTKGRFTPLLLALTCFVGDRVSVCDSVVRPVPVLIHITGVSHHSGIPSLVS